MPVNLKPETERLIEERMQSGGYETADELVLAALASLDGTEMFSGYAPGELDALIAEGEESLKRDGPLTHEEVFGALRAELDARRQSK